MTKEDIITTAIHEAFLCGKEAGEAYERAYHIMQKKVEEAKQGKLDHDLHMCDGIFGMAPNYRVKIDPESALNPDSKEVTFQVQSLPGQRIGDTPEEKITMLEHQCCLLKQENIDLQRQCEEKDATITELRSQLEEYKDCNQEHFRKEIAERDNIIGEERAEMQDMGRRINLLVNENLALLERNNKQDAELADLHRKYDELYAIVNPLAIGPNRQEAPAEPSHYSEGDKVLVSGAFFNNHYVYSATILEVMKDKALVLIKDRDGDFENEEFDVPYEYITKQ